jgi:hypothetical protein
MRASLAAALRGRLDPRIEPLGDLLLLRVVAGGFGAQIG